jgi:UDP-N-acetylmuramate dehydrogenase
VIDACELLADRFGRDRVRRDVTLGPFTSFRVGGPADWFIETRSADEVIAALGLARSAGMPITVLGGGSNMLVSDAGVRGLVIRMRGGTIQPIARGRVQADAAVSMNGLVRWTIHHGYAGLEAWAGTPGTVGGAIFGNAHFSGRLIGDLVESVRVVSLEGTLTELRHDEMAFGYDRSRLQETGEVMLSATFRVGVGDAGALRATARESLAYRKRTQPLDTRNAGCVFQNPDPARDRVPAGIPWSAGALVDRAGLKGAVEGAARVSPAHGNFIVNEGGATAGEIRRLIDRCRDEVRARFGVELRDEIVYVGAFETRAT